MTWHILSVLPNPGKMEQVRDVLKEELGEISFDFTGNEAKAKEKLSEKLIDRRYPYDLVVTSLDIPEDSKTMRVEGLRRGLDLAQWMQDENMNIPTILFKIVDDPEVETRVSKMELCELVHEKLGWEDDFKKRVRQKLGPPKASEQKKTDEQKRFDVDFRLDLDRKLAEYSFKGAINVEYRPLPIPKEFLELTTESRALEENIRVKGECQREWQPKLQRIGEKLMEHIFFQDKKFTALFWRTVSEVGGLGNTRIRFIVEKEVYPIALEAIYGPHQLLQEDYWMLHAPIYRTLGEFPGENRPLFQDQETRVGPLNILIIQSPTEGEVHIKSKGSEWPHVLVRLTNVIDECELLKNYRSSQEYKDRKGHVTIDKIKLIPIPNDTRSFDTQVQETLKEKWHIVHYAGHSFFDADTDEGYVFFPSGQDEKGKPIIKVVDLDLLSLWLRSAKPNLVFLSSCRSSEEGFVFALASKGIPATVGFRWDVEDKMAAAYTRVFYRVLFGGETKSLEYVFLKARQEIHDQYRNNPIWAAPVLVMQIPAR